MDLWRRVWNSLEPDVESWVVDTVRYLLLFGSVALARLLFAGLKIIGVSQEFVDILEKVDLGANGLLILMFLFSVFRKGLSVMLRGGKLRGGKKELR